VANSEIGKLGDVMLLRVKQRLELWKLSVRPAHGSPNPSGSVDENVLRLETMVQKLAMLMDVMHAFSDLQHDVNGYNDRKRA